MTIGDFLELHYKDLAEGIIVIVFTWAIVTVTAAWIRRMK